LTHRAIKAVLKGETYDPKAPWDVLGEQCSATERRADEATRDVTAWLKCYYMKDRLGEEFVGTISGVTSFGIFVTLDEVYVEGLVHISELGQDYFHFEQDKHRIMGERTRKIFQLADRVNIKVVRVDIETSKIDFALAGEVSLRPKASVAVAPTAPVPAPTPLAKAAEVVVPAKPGVKKPSAPVVVAPVTTQKSEKKIISVTSANPPTTPLAGFAGDGVAKSKSRAAPKPVQPALPKAKTAKVKQTGVLLGGKKKTEAKKVETKNATSKTNKKKARKK
jgi:ribonuclease R